ncbi:MAG: hypothetical protein V3V31_11670 [Methylococcales bacterium]
MIKILAPVLFAVLMITSACAEQKHNIKHDVESSASQNIQFPEEIKQLFLQEMAFLQTGMSSLVPAIVSGHWDQIATIGEHMRDSYIMKHNLSDSQKKSIHQALPPEFIELDHGFHRTAGMLAHAARKKDSELVNFYFYRLVDTCVACHSKYASNRFPELVVEHGQGSQHH